MNNPTNRAGQGVDQQNLYHNVPLLSPAEIEGPSDFTKWEPLLLISRPCNPTDKCYGSRRLSIEGPSDTGVSQHFASGSRRLSIGVMASLTWCCFVFLSVSYCYYQTDKCYYYHFNTFITWQVLVFI